jgi:hypothetical protein
LNIPAGWKVVGMVSNDGSTAGGSVSSDGPQIPGLQVPPGYSIQTLPPPVQELLPPATSPAPKVSSPQRSPPASIAASGTAKPRRERPAEPIIRVADTGTSEELEGSSLLSPDVSLLKPDVGDPVGTAEGAVENLLDYATGDEAEKPTPILSSDQLGHIMSVECLDAELAGDLKAQPCSKPRLRKATPRQEGSEPPAVNSKAVPLKSLLTRGNVDGPAAPVPQPTVHKRLLTRGRAHHVQSIVPIVREGPLERVVDTVLGDVQPTRHAHHDRMHIETDAEDANAKSLADMMEKSETP